MDACGLVRCSAVRVHCCEWIGTARGMSFAACHPRPPPLAVLPQTHEGIAQIRLRLLLPEVEGHQGPPELEGQGRAADGVDEEGQEQGRVDLVQDAGEGDEVGEAGEDDEGQGERRGGEGVDVAGQTLVGVVDQAVPLDAVVGALWRGGRKTAMGGWRVGSRGDLGRQLGGSGQGRSCRGRRRAAGSPCRGTRLGVGASSTVASRGPSCPECSP